MCTGGYRKYSISVKMFWILFLLSLSITSAIADVRKREYYLSRAQYSSTTEAPYDDGNSYPNDSYSRRLRTKNNPSIIKQSNNQELDGSYNYEYETQNGIRAKETSSQVNGDKVVRGSYSYIGPDGFLYTVNYIADRNGYRAYGAHLPTQPDAVSSVVNRVRDIASSTISPVWNENVETSPGYAYPSSTPVPFIHQTLVPPSDQYIPYSTTPLPYRTRPFYAPSSPAQRRISSTVTPIRAIIIPQNSAEQNLFNPYYRQSPTPFPYISSTTDVDIDLEDFDYSSSTSRPFNAPDVPLMPQIPQLPQLPQSTPSPPLPSPFIPTPSTNYSDGDEDTVVITPPPRTYIQPVTTRNYLERDLLPPYVASRYIPHVQPLYHRSNLNRFRNGYE